MEHADSHVFFLPPDQMNNTCKNCQHWQRNTEIIGKPPDVFGDCNNPKYIYTPDYVPPVYPTDSFLYWDSEDYAAGFATGENFGCIHFAMKQD